MTTPDVQDAAHVVLDALDMLRKAIERDSKVHPWDDYAEHAVSTRDGYMAAIKLADKLASEVLS